MPSRSRAFNQLIEEHHEYKNQVTLVGNIGFKPELKGQTKSGEPIVTFAVAQNVSGLDPATQSLVKKDPQWFQISCFSGLAERALSSLNKGDLVLVAGELKSRSYQTASGEKRSSVEIVARDILLVQRLRKSHSDGPFPEVSELASSEFDTFDSEVPIA